MVKINPKVDMLSWFLGEIYKYLVNQAHHSIYRMVKINPKVDLLFLGEIYKYLVNQAHHSIYRMVKINPKVDLLSWFLGEIYKYLVNTSYCIFSFNLHNKTTYTLLSKFMQLHMDGQPSPVALDHHGLHLLLYLLSQLFKSQLHNRTFH
jgi:uncharacterized pyridoxamine 5'-phosphate oxidase family protein